MSNPPDVPDNFAGRRPARERTTLESLTFWCIARPDRARLWLGERGRTHRRVARYSGLRTTARRKAAANGPGQTRGRDEPFSPLPSRRIGRSGFLRFKPVAGGKRPSLLFGRPLVSESADERFDCDADEERRQDQSADRTKHLFRGRVKRRPEIAVGEFSPSQPMSLIATPAPGKIAHGKISLFLRLIGSSAVVGKRSRRIWRNDCKRGIKRDLSWAPGKSAQPKPTANAVADILRLYEPIRSSSRQCRSEREPFGRLLMKHVETCILFIASDPLRY